MCSREGKADYPPPLPIKQRRSAYSGGSSTGSSMDLEPEREKMGSLHETTYFSDVFSVSTDCQAPQCPIHHSAGYDPPGHQERFFSSNTPPPVPKKRLARALSLPGGCVHPQCSLPSKHQNYDNPLYMLTPIKDSQLDMERVNQKPHFETPPPRQPLSLLTFDTPDLQLPRFFKSFQDQEQISLDIQECHLLFLKRIAQQFETLSLSGVESTEGIQSFQPHDFRLCEGYQPKNIGDTVFYSVDCPKLPGRGFSAKVYRPHSEGTVPALLMRLPPHINIQQLFVHFPQCLEPERYTNAENLQAANSPARPQQHEWEFLQSPDGGSTEQERQHQEPPEQEGRMIASLLSEGYEVDIERELPQGTLEDFVRDGITLHHSKPQLYERQLSLLLLQLAQGLLHLHRHGATCADLQMQHVILAWSEAKKGAEAEGEIEGVDEKGACGRGTEELECEEGVGQNHGAPIHKLWKRWGPPRVVITEIQPLSQSNTGTDSEEFRLGRLLLSCLHLPERPVLLGPEPSTQGSPLPQGLLQLALQLLDPQTGVRMVQAVGILQVLLWGPRAELFQKNQPGAWPKLLASWLAVKRSLLIQKLSELALSKAYGGPDQEDNLCLQYLSLAEPDILLKITTLLGLRHTAH